MAFEETRRKVQRTYQNKVVAAPKIGAAAPRNDLDGVFDSMLKFANAYDEKRKEEDSIKQSERAAKDLMVSTEARQGVTEDATNAGKLAYNTIISRKDATDASQTFIEWYQNNPTAGDDEITAKKQELYSPILTKYESDSPSLKQASLAIQEVQFSLAPMQSKIKNEYLSNKADEAIGVSIGQALADPNVDVNDYVVNELPQIAKTLGKGEFDYKKQILDQAVLTAKNGDGRLLSYLEKQDWSANLEQVQTARTMHDRFVSQQNAVQIGDEKGSIAIDATSGNTTWNTTLARITDLNKRYPNSYSDDAIASLKIQAANAKKQRQAHTELSKYEESTIKDYDAVPIGLRSDLTNKEISDYVKVKDSQWAEQYQSLMATGKFTEAEVNSAVLDQKIKWSRIQRVVIPSVKSSLDALINLNPQEFQTASDMPDYAAGALQMAAKMDTSMIDMYFSTEKDKAFMSNFISRSENKDSFNAYKEAATIRQNPFNVRSEEFINQRDASDSVVKSELSARFYEFNKTTVPEWNRKRVAAKVSDASTLTLVNGGTDVKANAKIALDNIMARSYQAPNGTLINRSLGQLAQDSGIKKEKVGSAIDAVIYNALEHPEVKALNLTYEDLGVEFSNDGMSFTLINSSGHNLGGRFHTKDLQNILTITDEAKLKALQEEGKQNIKHRKKAEELEPDFWEYMEQGFKTRY